MKTHNPRRGSPDADAVLDAAHALLATGLGQVTVRGVAVALGVSRQVVYSRFGNKQGLLGALYVDGFGRLAGQVRGARGTPGTLAHIRAVAKAYRRFALDHTQLFSLMFLAPEGFSPSPQARASARAWFACVTDAVRAWMGEQPALEVSVQELATRIWSAVHGAVVLELVGHRAAPVDALAVGLLQGALYAGRG